jgi:hypothetical protein
MATQLKRRTLQHGDPVPSGQPRRTVLVTGYVQLEWRVGVKDYITVYEHRLVMGLPPVGVVVHHKNGIKTDNRPENLELIESQSEHARHHMPLKFDIEEAKRLYLSGLSHKRIARIVGVDHSNVSRRLRAHGVKTRQFGCLTHCRRGHELVGANVVNRRDGWRECRTCRRDAQRRWREARSANGNMSTKDSGFTE